MQKWWERQSYDIAIAIGPSKRRLNLPLSRWMTNLDATAKESASPFVLLCFSLVLLARQLQSVMRVHQACLTVDDVYIVFGCVVAWALLYLEVAMMGTSNSATIHGHWIGPGIVLSSQQFCKGHTVCHFNKFKLRKCKRIGEVKQ